MKLPITGRFFIEDVIRLWYEEVNEKYVYVPSNRNLTPAILIACATSYQNCSCEISIPLDCFVVNDYFLSDCDDHTAIALKEVSSVSSALSGNTKSPLVHWQSGLRIDGQSGDDSFTFSATPHPNRLIINKQIHQWECNKIYSVFFFTNIQIWWN